MRGIAAASRTESGDPREPRAAIHAPTLDEKGMAMHLAQMLALRPVPASAIFLSLTRRCPLSCAHCSTNSTMISEEHSGEMFLRFVRTFTAAERPELLLLTGGEALLRPRLVRDLAEAAHAVGTRVMLISGMFWARQPRVPPLIDQAIRCVDHLTASLDVFHEREVSRAQVFAALQRLRDRGQDVSLQVVGLNDDDPYLADLIADIRAYFHDQVPALAVRVGASGRAATWFVPEALPTPTDVPPQPCPMAAWPTVAYDGTVAACCNQTVIDGPVPSHLRLGHIAVDGWREIRERTLQSGLLRAIRVVGPEYLVARHGSGAARCDGYCETCYRLPDDPALARRADTLMASPGMRLIEKQVQVLQQSGFVRRQGIARYEFMATLGYAPERSATCAG
jgi:pyruvate-formate lyase-activating enzyme